VPSLGDGPGRIFSGAGLHHDADVAPATQDRRAIIFFYAKRLPGGADIWSLHAPLPPLSGEPEQAHANQCRAGSTIRDCPEQYLWSYNR